MIVEAIRTKFPEGYWPVGMEPAAQFHSLDSFQKEIFPIWKGIQEKEDAAEKLLTAAQVFRPGQLMLEVRTLHKQDAAIYNSGIKPMRSDLNQEMMSRLRAKALRASGKDRAAGD